MIQLKNVVFSRADGAVQRRIINNVSVTIEGAQQVALVGDSGSGKTTLLNLLAGLLMPDSGEIKVNGTVISGFDDNQLALYRRKIGVIFQHYQLLEALNVADNITFQARLNGLEVSQQTLSTLAQRLGIAHKLTALPCELSGGEQQRVGIARAIINQPKVILADEPTGNLDSERSQEVLELLQSLCKEHQINLVMVTHSEKLAVQFERQLRLKNGQLHD
ncbi:MULTISPECIES: ABC transporter ATP-binding protein [Pseudoalteromonas]|uniref:ABC transporter ATP-binding protein n=1 Tax=Pseudoalteromonas obscura TaxID=3048491 RepID=A0ABT7EKF7_9GAMM|nr:MULTISPECIES: ABC transporter ATP-binding protein [Pseudoalteromonas]MBQ4837237.1 ABC transporter ATP-binding protein [Pseudoalteromonas luteoviolacea]MDK2595540.1 ABC transporter ATP-binding protein [Pseudoalteromonas sp. P94(2023)]